RGSRGATAAIAHVQRLVDTATPSPACGGGSKGAASPATRELASGVFVDQAAQAQCRRAFGLVSARARVRGFAPRCDPVGTCAVAPGLALADVGLAQLQAV